MEGNRNQFMSEIVAAGAIPAAESAVPADAYDQYLLDAAAGEGMVPRVVEAQIPVPQEAGARLQPDVSLNVLK